MSTVPKWKQSSDDMRTKPELLDSSGQAFWKLRSYNGEYVALLQAATATDERWSIYGPKEKDEIGLYVQVFNLLKVGIRDYVKIFPETLWLWLTLNLTTPTMDADSLTTNKDGFSISKYAELKPVPCLTYSDAQSWLQNVRLLF